MRQLFAIVLIALVAAAAANTNCSAVKRPPMGSNFYMPDDSCLSAEPTLKACSTGFDKCVNATPATCGNVEGCVKNYLNCITLTPIDTTASTNCTTWATGLNNFMLYLAAGGIYNGSLLQQACTYTVCGGAQQAYKMNVKTADGMICPVNAANVCMPPNFDAPTAAPNQASYTLTFGGDWGDVSAALSDKTSAAYKKIESALQTGIGKLLGVEAWKIAIVSITIASLKVEFLVNDATFSADQIKAKINDAIASGTISTSFTELAAATGKTITVTGLEVADPSTPAPPSSAASVAAVMAFVAMVAAMLF